MAKAKLTTRAISSTAVTSDNLAKGSQLTHNQLDSNFINLRDATFGVVADDSSTIQVGMDSNLYIQGGSNVTTSVDSAGVVTINATGEVTASSSDTFTNKSIDVDNNTITNIEVDNLKSGVLDTDLTSVAGTDTTLASAKAIKTYVDAEVAGSSLGDLTATGSTLQSPSNAAITLDPSGTGTIELNANTNVTGDLTTSAISLVDNTISTSQSNANLELEPSGSGEIRLGADTRIVDNSTQSIIGNLRQDGGSNLQISTLAAAGLTAGGGIDIAPYQGTQHYGAFRVTRGNAANSDANKDATIETDNLRFGGSAGNTAQILGLRSNEDISIQPAGAGNIILGAVKINGTTLSSDDSTKITVAEAVDVTGALVASTSLTLATGATVTGVDNGALGTSATLLATQGAIKTYVDASVSGIGGDITSVVAGTGMTGGGTTADVTLNVIGGTGITANANDIAIDATVATLAGSQTLTNKVLTSAVLNTGVSGTAIKDENNMASDSATHLATQQSIKAYVDSEVGGVAQGQGFTVIGDDSAGVGIPEAGTLYIQGGTGITTATDSAGVITINGQVGDVTSVVAGAGMTGGGTDGDVTLNVIGGTGIDVAADAVSVDVSDFLTNGVNNRVVTATGADAMNSEANLTFDGSTLAVTGNQTISGNLTVSGDTTTVSTTNTTIEDNIIELNSGLSQSLNDSGIIIERGSTGNNAAIIWDESEDEFILGTTTATGADKSSGISVTAGNLKVATIEATTAAITGGAITGITDLAVADGGTGASSLTSNAVLTGTGTSPITAEGNLSFDGSTLAVTGAATVSTTLGVTGASNLDGVTITDNTISTNASNADLGISANGTGRVNVSPSGGDPANNLVYSNGFGTTDRNRGVRLWESVSAQGAMTAAGDRDFGHLMAKEWRLTSGLTSADSDNRYRAFNSVAAVDLNGGAITATSSFSGPQGGNGYVYLDNSNGSAATMNHSSGLTGGIYVYPTNGAITAQTTYGVRADIGFDGSNAAVSATNSYGFHVAMYSDGGTTSLTNGYGVYVSDLSLATNKYAFYDATNSLSVFGDVQTQAVSITDNHISTNRSNDNLYIEANGTGRVNIGDVKLEDTVHWTDVFGNATRVKGNALVYEDLAVNPNSLSDRELGHAIYMGTKITASSTNSNFRPRCALIGSVVDLAGFSYTNTSNFRGPLGAQIYGAVSGGSGTDTTCNTIRGVESSASVADYSSTSGAITVVHAIGNMTANYHDRNGTGDINITNDYGFKFAPEAYNAGGGTGVTTITNSYGFHVSANGGNATTTNAYAFYSTNAAASSRMGAIRLDNQSGDPTHGADFSWIFAKDESASSEVFVKDEAGNVTKISPHNAAGDWEYYSKNTKTGKTVRVNMEAMIRDIEGLTGNTYIENE